MASCHATAVIRRDPAGAGPLRLGSGSSRRLTRGWAERSRSWR